MTKPSRSTTQAWVSSIEISRPSKILDRSVSSSESRPILSAFAEGAPPFADDPIGKLAKTNRPDAATLAHGRHA
jgi:hypothetical protein